MLFIRILYSVFQPSFALGHSDSYLQYTDDGKTLGIFDFLATV